MTGTVHVIGAGLAGLSAAVLCAKAGNPIRLYEAAPCAGGRTRSFHDPVLGCLIDNGPHLLMGANRTVLGFLKLTGGIANVQAAAPEYHLHSRPHGRIRRITPHHPGMGFFEMLCALGLPRIHPNDTVAKRLSKCKSFTDVFEPLCLAVLNTNPEHASAALLARVLRAVMLGGKSAMIPYLFPQGLSAALIDPALLFLKQNGGSVAFNHRLESLCQSRLTFRNALIDLDSDDSVILALPPWALERILPDMGCFKTETIINIHYRLPVKPPPGPPIGLSGAVAQWLFVRDHIASASISAASALRDLPAKTLAEKIWSDIGPLLTGAPSSLPPFRVMTEKRATLRHSPAATAARPGVKTAFQRVFLAGDWLQSPWPCTMESAVSSGLTAARTALKRDDLRFP